MKKKTAPLTAAEILALDIENLSALVAANKPLTAHQRKALEVAAGISAAPDGNPRFAKNHSQLATALAVSRHVIGYHARRPGSPCPKLDGRLDIREWRAYLQAVGHVTVRGELPPPGSPLTFADGLDAAHEKFTDTLTELLPLALAPAKIKATKAQISAAADVLWLLVTLQLERIAKANGLPGFIEQNQSAPPWENDPCDSNGP